MASTVDISSLESDPRLFLYTSLTAGSSHIITATSRMETILKANKIPFQAIDTATDEKARKLWQRRAGKRKLPGLVKEGYVIGDLEEIEEWNEFGELKDNIGPVPASNAAPPGGQTGVNIAPPLPVNPTATAGTSKISQPGAVTMAPTPGVDQSKMRALPGAAEIAARNKPETTSIDSPPKVETMSSAPAEKEESIDKAKAVPKHLSSVDHLSAPASRIQSGTATPAEPADVKESEPTATASHRGSEIKAVPAEEVKKVESETAVPEEDAEEESAVKGVEGLQVGEGTKVQQQSAGEAGDAGKSVED